MALPTTIVSDVGLAGHHPPYISSAGATYGVVRADPNELDVKKAIDPEDSWTLKDSASGPVHAGTLLGYATYQDGDIIHIVAWSAGTYEYYTFDMSTDTWDIDELMETPNDAPTFPWASLAVRSGVPVVVYAGDTDRVKGDKKERVDVAHRDGGTWTVGIALDTAGDIHYGNPNCVLGTNDSIHFVWQAQHNTADDPPIRWGSQQGRTLNSSNSLSAPSGAVEDSADALLGFQNTISYDDSGTQRILTSAGPDISGTRSVGVSQGEEDGSGNTKLTGMSTNGMQEQHINGEVSILTIAELSGDVHLLFSGGGTDGVDQDLFYTTSTDDGASWSTPIKELDGVTVNFISANIYVRDIDTVLAYIYEDNGVQMYGEKILIAGQTHDMML